MEEWFWFCIAAGTLCLVGGALNVRWRSLGSGRFADGQALWLSLLGLGVATIVQNSAHLNRWKGGGLLATEIVDFAFASMFAVLAVKRALPKRRRNS